LPQHDDEKPIPREKFTKFTLTEVSSFDNKKEQKSADKEVCSTQLIDPRRNAVAQAFHYLLVGRKQRRQQTRRRAKCGLINGWPHRRTGQSNDSGFDSLYAGNVQFYSGQLAPIITLCSAVIGND